VVSHPFRRKKRKGWGTEVAMTRRGGGLREMRASDGLAIRRGGAPGWGEPNSKLFGPREEKALRRQGYCACFALPQLKRLPMITFAIQ